MSGHSKWAQIHRQKGVADAKRGARFTRLANNVTLAAKLGGGSPETNFRLRLAIDQAKAGNMPKDNIERAIKRGTGELAGQSIESITYEGFGPAGIALMIEALTDNRNRTSSAIKHIFSKFGGSMGGPNSVAWMFEQKGIVHTSRIDENFELELIDAGAQDIVRDESGVTVYTGPTNLQKVKELLESRDLPIEYAEIEQVAKEKKELGDQERQAIQKMLEELEENEDVSNYYVNVEI